MVVDVLMEKFFVHDTVAYQLLKTPFNYFKKGVDIQSQGRPVMTRGAHGHIGGGTPRTFFNVSSPQAGMGGINGKRYEFWLR